jgi:hypothetical protein
MAPKFQTHGDQQTCLTGGNNINTTVWVINPTSPQQSLQNKIENNEPPKPAGNNNKKKQRASKTG